MINVIRNNITIDKQILQALKNMPILNWHKLMQQKMKFITETEVHFNACQFILQFEMNW